MKVIAEFLAKPGSIKRMLIKAMFYSLRYKRIIKRQPFAEYAKQMGCFKYETPIEKINDPILSDIKWIVYAVNRWTPWKTLCFDQALMAKKLLNEKGLPCTIYMGVRRSSDNKLVAHAWLRCGTEFISGGDGIAQGYAVTGIYGDKEMTDGKELS